MCMITLYKETMSDQNKLAEKISRYKLDLADKTLTIYPLLQEPQEFKINRSVSWDESNDSMIID